MFKIDHIVFAASSLEEGTSFIESHLQTKLSDIGHHDFMGTHNRVLKIDPNHKIACHLYGKILLKINRHVEGLNFIKKASGMIRFTDKNLNII